MTGCYLVLGHFLQNATCQTVFINAGFLYVGHISFDIPTWLKRHITRKYQVSKVHFARYLSKFFFAFFSIKHNIIIAENRKYQVGILIDGTGTIKEEYIYPSPPFGMRR
jgi:hypothetical protein